jgi:hypothetical protein
MPQADALRGHGACILRHASRPRTRGLRSSLAAQDDMRYFDFARPQFILLAAIVLFVVPALIYLVNQREVDGWILVQVEGPRLQETFGFTAAHVPTSMSTGTMKLFQIASVRTGGLLDLAGFRAGDIPVGYKHGFEASFYADLLYAAEGHVVQIRVVSAADIDKGADAWRTLTLQPASARGAEPANLRVNPPLSVVTALAQGGKGRATRAAG